MARVKRGVQAKPGSENSMGADIIGSSAKQIEFLLPGREKRNINI